MIRREIYLINDLILGKHRHFAVGIGPFTPEGRRLICQPVISLSIGWKKGNWMDPNAVAVFFLCKFWTAPMATKMNKNGCASGLQALVKTNYSKEGVQQLIIIFRVLLHHQRVIIKMGHLLSSSVHWKRVKWLENGFIKKKNTKLNKFNIHLSSRKRRNNSNFNAIM